MAGNSKYAVKPEVLRELKFTPRDEELAKVNNLIQGIIRTQPDNWNETQLLKAKHFKLNTLTADEVRWIMDNEIGD